MPAAWHIWLLCRAAARGLQLAGSFTAFGTILLTVVLLPPTAVSVLRRSLTRLVWAACLVGIGAGLAWFALQTVNMAEPRNFRALATALPMVADTRFGRLLVLRCLLLAAATLWIATSRPAWPALLPALAAVAGEAWLDHGGAMASAAGTTLLISDIFHLLGGAAWIGSLPALWLAVGRLPLPEAALLARRYSPLGMTAVGALTASAAVQSVVLVGAPAALLRTGYGQIVLVKVGLLAALVAIAAHNRSRLVPTLMAGSQPARTALRRNVALEALLGLTALLAAALLLNLDPPTMAAMLHAEGGS